MLNVAAAEQAIPDVRGFYQFNAKIPCLRNWDLINNIFLCGFIVQYFSTIESVLHHKFSPEVHDKFHPHYPHSKTF